ncbi:MAG: hypothetical protein V2I43_25890 [Parvularcula sp.]|jgi:hypothetical protein|nr:hypothetical protein [Parvularcula sp.]
MGEMKRTRFSDAGQGSAAGLSGKIILTPAAMWEAVVYLKACHVTKCQTKQETPRASHPARLFSYRRLHIFLG